jgi:hypothetical protein
MKPFVIAAGFTQNIRKEHTEELPDVVLPILAVQRYNRKADLSPFI